MNSSIGFVIPKADLNRAYLRLLPWAAIGLAIPVALGRTSVLNSLSTAAYAAILIGILYWYVLGYKWILLAPSGIRGLSSTGKKVTISWSEAVSIGRRVAFNGISCISVQPNSKGTALMLPSSIAATPEFLAALDRMAPASHPLRNCGSNAL
jgi:hypothetical protein